MSGRVSAMSDIASFRQYEGRRGGLKGGQILGCMDNVSLMVCDMVSLSMSLLDAFMELVRTRGGGGYDQGMCEGLVSSPKSTFLHSLMGRVASTLRGMGSGFMPAERRNGQCRVKLLHWPLGHPGGYRGAHRGDLGHLQQGRHVQGQRGG